MGLCQSKGTGVVYTPRPVSPVLSSVISPHIISGTSRSMMVPSHELNDPNLNTFYNELKTKRNEQFKSLPRTSNIKILKRPGSYSNHRDVMSIFGEKGYVLDCSNIATEVNTPTSSTTSSTHPSSPTNLFNHIQNSSLSIVYGSASISGQRVINEDRIACYIHQGNESNLGYFGVYDGHGGSNVSEYLAKHLHNQVFKEYDENPTNSIDTILHDSMIAIDNMIYDQGINHGSTAISMVIDGNQMAFASLGDSQAILSCNNGRDIIDLCNIHRPSETSERERIFAAKGTVIDGRVFGLLGVSRAFGDNDLKTSKGSFKEKFNGDVISCIPDVHLHVLAPQDDFVVLGCDGIFDVLDPTQLVRYIHTRMNHTNDIQNICDDVVAHAMRLGSTDNLSIVIVQFHQE